MLVDLTVRDLGVIESARIELGAGMTVLTGETGAGKTLVVGALALLVGGRGDPAVVRPGADEAVVEGRFLLADGSDGSDGSDELVLSRTVAARGRSRAWIDSRMAPLSALAERGPGLVELHGQHAHRALVDPAAQRRALDAFAAVDLGPLGRARAAVRQATAALEGMGGDSSIRARHVELLRFQVDEIAAAAIEDDDEDQRLADEEDRLAEMAAHREAAGHAQALLVGLDGGGAADGVGRARALLAASFPLAALADRLAAVHAELEDVAGELRTVAETWEEDPGRLDEVRSRRQLLRVLARKYGGDLAAVLAHAEATRRELQDLADAEADAEAAARRLAGLQADVAAAEHVVGEARRQAAPRLASAVEERLRSLGMPRALLQVHVGDVDPGDDVEIRFCANPGEAVLPLAKVASGGELARAMLALRLVLSEAPPTMVFDEVDAGIGGTAAIAVGRALWELGRRHQVLVVTHLPQVAAFADRHLTVGKETAGGRTVARVQSVVGDDRLVELARMLSGQPGSTTARRHAAELLEQAHAIA